MGVAKFDWTDGGAQSLTLALKLQTPIAAHDKERHTAISLDRTKHEVLVVGAGAKEAIVSIRVDSQMKETDDFIESGLDGIALTMTPDTATPATTIPVQMMAASRIELEWDNLKVYRVRMLRFRRLDGLTFNDLFAV